MMAYNLFQVAYNARMCLNVSIKYYTTVKYKIVQGKLKRIDIRSITVSIRKLTKP